MGSFIGNSHFSKILKVVRTYKDSTLNTQATTIASSKIANENELETNSVALGSCEKVEGRPMSHKKTEMSSEKEDMML